MKFEALLYEIEDHILTITFNRPEAMNAFNGPLYKDLFTALDMADADDEVKAVIITGAGRGFCAGADLSQGDKTWEGVEESQNKENKGDGGGQITRRIYDMLKPVIVAFNGPAVGMGMTITLSADIRLAVKGIKMGFVFSARGLIPEGCASWFLPRLVGISKALEWCYSGKVFRSEEALEAGLVRSLHEPEDLLPAARELAHELVDNSSSISRTVLRHMLWKMLGASDPIEAHRVDTAGIHALGTSPDAREGINSFLEKRPPNFPGKVSQDLPEFFPWWEKQVF
jgi:enoyl-CoA hydratase/carnithine racemase